MVVKKWIDSNIFYRSLEFKLDQIREKYGEDTIKGTNQKWGTIDKATYEEMQSTEKQLLFDLTTYLQDQTDQEIQNDKVFVRT